MKIIFMGSSAFSLPALQSLIDSEHEVVAVYTQAPKAVGRGYKETLSIVHQLANKHNILVKTPKTLRNQEDQQEFAEFNADCAVVASYGLLLPEEILNAPKYGCINIHPSILPKWRGAAPLQHTILSGDSKTGVCIMKMDKGLDSGDIYSLEYIELSPEITTMELHDICAEKGAKMLMQVLNNIDHLVPVPQSSEGITYASKLTKAEGAINWHESAELIARKIRALSPWPGTYFTFRGETVKLLAANYTLEKHVQSPATIINENFAIACGEGIILPKILQRPGRKAMLVEEMLRGYQVQIGEKVS